MRQLFGMLALAGLVATTVAMAPAVQAEDGDDATLCSYCWEKGSFTEENPEASRVLLFPVRVVSAGVGATVGALMGAAEGIHNSLDVVSDVTFGRIATDEYDNGFTNTTVTLIKAPILGSMGIVGTAAAIPCGVAYGLVTGTFKGMAKGYMWPDTF